MYVIGLMQWCFSRQAGWGTEKESVGGRDRMKGGRGRGPLKAPKQVVESCTAETLSQRYLVKRGVIEGHQTIDWGELTSAQYPAGGDMNQAARGSHILQFNYLSGLLLWQMASVSSNVIFVSTSESLSATLSADCFIVLVDFIPRPAVSWWAVWVFSSVCLLSHCLPLLFLLQILFTTPSPVSLSFSLLSSPLTPQCCLPLSLPCPSSLPHPLSILPPRLRSRC